MILCNEFSEKNFRTINEMKEGAYFGEVGLLTNLHRTCSVIALT
jgi:CRP-like cAMP-binding protein